MDAGREGFERPRMCTWDAYTADKKRDPSNAVANCTKKQGDAVLDHQSRLRAVVGRLESRLYPTALTGARPWPRSEFRQAQG